MIDIITVKCPGCGQDAYPRPSLRDAMDLVKRQHPDRYRVFFPVEHKLKGWMVEPLCEMTLCVATWDFDPRRMRWLN